ncbi:S-layer homology domain-containing protein [Paraliobacillus salinarum]|uniref:S-layer homology domain-containing protein n=1 Tax=Paraliobacillus salinarum TaxID=1158996 RepID=UPI0015F529D9|nr:S-layer homology domain-containing protein [Paraliobacillus salinarum]
MRMKARQKHYSIMLIFVLLLSAFTPAVAPMNANAATTDQTISVADAINLNNDGSQQSVQGYIVGFVDSGNVSNNPTDFANDYNVAIADNKEVTDKSQMLFVKVESQYRGEFGLQTNPDNLGKEVIVDGTMTAYHGHNGLKDATSMKFTSEKPSEPLELKTITDARAQGTGEVKTKGIVTGILKNNLFIQDENAAIAIYPVIPDVNLGDEITVTGSLGEHNGLLQLQGVTVDAKNTETTVPNPITLEGSQLKDHESELALVENVSIVSVYDGGNWANYTVKDASGTEFIVRDETNSLNLNVGQSYSSIAGMITQYKGEFQITPRTKADIIADSSVVQAVVATPNSGKVPAGQEVALKTSTADATIYYTTDGSDPVENGKLYEGAITVDSEMSIKAYAKKDGLKNSEVATFAYTVYDPQEGIQIHDIQGESHHSSMVGDIVENVEGIVTYVFDIRGSHYFNMQLPEADQDNNPKTSEGIVVYTGKQEDVKVGDKVEVTGKVDEYYIDGYSSKAETDLPITQINARDDKGGIISVVESGVALPEVIEIKSSDIPSKISGEQGFNVFEPENFSIDYWESMEAMRVEVLASRAIAPQEHGDLVVVTNEFETAYETINGGILLTEEGPNAQSIQFKLQPNSPARDFAVKTGDLFVDPLSGVVMYGYGNYKVYTDLSDAEKAFKEGSTKPEKTDIVKAEDELTVASYNVENFSNNTSQTSEQKAQNIARAFVEDMNSPDIIGVVEVQDNNGQDEGPDNADASESYQRLIEDIEGRGGPTYAYANINPEYNQDGGAPGGNIRVGYLYNPDRVSLTDAEHGTATDAVGYEDGKLTFNPGRISPNKEIMDGTRKPLAAQFEFQGESVVVVNAHLNSKRGDDPFYGQNQPPNFGSRVERIELAKLINTFVSDVIDKNPDENVVVVGDMNDYEFSEPLQVLAGDELTNKVFDVPTSERYTYVYQGNSHVFDQALVSNNIANDTEIDIIHVNADFTDMHGRASDHDPVLIQIDLANEPADNSDMFEDIEGHWARNVINDLAKQGIIFGYGDGRFGPNDTFTRGDFTSLIVRSLELESANFNHPFSDVSGAFKNEVAIAYNLGIINGYPGDVFKPEATITREEMASIIVRAYTEVNDLKSARGLFGRHMYKDASKIHLSHKDSVTIAHKLDLMIGMENNYFAPKSVVTRAEGASVIFRMLK